MRCPCGETEFTMPTHVGSALFYTQVDCLSCERRASVLISPLGGVLVFGPPTLVRDWIHGHLIPIVRAHTVLRRVHDQHEWDTWVDRVFRRKFPSVDTTNLRERLPLLPPAARQAIRDQFGKRASEGGTFIPYLTQWGHVPAHCTPPELVVYYAGNDDVAEPDRLAG